MPVRQRASRRATLAMQIGDQLVGRVFAEAVLLHQSPAETLLAKLRVGLFKKQPDLLAEEEVAIFTLAAPEWRDAARPAGGNHLHVAVADVFDAPGLQADVKLLAQPPFPDEFLIELADDGARPRRRMLK